MKRTILILILIIAFLAGWTIVLARKNNELDIQISSLQSKVDLLNAQVSDLEEQKNALAEKFSNLSSAYRTLSKERMLSHLNSSTGNLSSSRGLATVVYRSSSCDCFILENQSGFIVAEWMGGNDPDLGDKVTGNFNSFGIMDFYNETKDTDCSLWIDDYMLDKEGAMDNLKDLCQ